MPEDFYSLLGVDKSATDDEIKRAYRKLARELHPDANGGDLTSEARFKEVTVAYETLRDPERRRRYDTFGPEGAARGSGAPGDIFGGGLGDLFDAFFGGQSGFAGQRPNGPRRGDDLEVVVDLEFKDAVFGVEQSVSFRCAVVCATCEGSGAKKGTTPIRCADCGGIGQVRRVRQSILGQVVTTSPCPRCRGLGEVIESVCEDCRGEGRRLEDQTVTVEVPAGVDEGTTLRIPSQGGAAFRQGVQGDLYVHLRVKQDERFQRAGNDLVTTVHIAMTQAALGATIDVETLEDPVPIEITPGTQSGRVIRLKGLGVPNIRGRGRGDLHVQIAVDTPGELSHEERDLLKQIARIRNEPIAAEDRGLLSRLKSSFS